MTYGQNTPSYHFEKRQHYIERSRDILSDLPSYCADYISDKLASEKFQPSTCYAYAGELGMFFDFLTSSGRPFENQDKRTISLEQLNTLTYHVISAYLSHVTSYKQKDEDSLAEKVRVRTNGGAAKARKYSCIRSFFSYLVLHHLISNNPCLGVDAPEIKEKPIVKLDTDDKRAFYDSVRSGLGLTGRQLAISEYMKLRDDAIVSLLLGTGIRVSELVGIDLGDINELKSSIMIIRKGGKIQPIYMGPNLFSLIQEYIQTARPHFVAPESLDTEQALFLSQQRRRITVRSVENLVKKYADASLGVGSGISPHKLRSTYGTNLYRATGDINLVADALGHSNINTSAKHYIDIGDERRRLAGDIGDIE